MGVLFLPTGGGNFLFPFAAFRIVRPGPRCALEYHYTLPYFIIQDTKDDRCSKPFSVPVGPIQIVQSHTYVVSTIQMLQTSTVACS
jgi:hypothetical protein